MGDLSGLSNDNPLYEDAKNFIQRRMDCLIIGELLDGLV